MPADDRFTGAVAEWVIRRPTAVRRRRTADRRAHDDGTTVLTGHLADQAQLHGLLARIRDLGAPLLSLRALEGSRTDGLPACGRAGSGDLRH